VRTSGEIESYLNWSVSSGFLVIPVLSTSIFRPIHIAALRKIIYLLVGVNRMAVAELFTTRRCLPVQWLGLGYVN